MPTATVGSAVRNLVAEEFRARFSDMPGVVNDVVTQLGHDILAPDLTAAVLVREAKTALPHEDKLDSAYGDILDLIAADRT